MYNLECIQENETHKIQWDFEIQTDYLISARRPYLLTVNKKKREPAELWTLHQSVKLKEREKRDKYFDLARELKKNMEHESDGDTNCDLCTQNRHQRN